MLQWNPYVLAVLTSVTLPNQESKALRAHRGTEDRQDET